MAGVEQPNLQILKPMLENIVREAEGAPGGAVALAAAMTGKFIRSEFEAEMARRFGPGGSGGVVFSDTITDMMILDPDIGVWPILSQGQGETIDVARLAEMRGEAGTAAAFPILPVEGISLAYDWISYRALKLSFTIDAYAKLIEAPPLDMARMLAATTSALIQSESADRRQGLMTLAIDVMLGFGRLPRKTAWNMAPPPKQPPPKTMALFGRFFG